MLISSFQTFLQTVESYIKKKTYLDTWQCLSNMIHVLHGIWACKMDILIPVITIVNVNNKTSKQSTWTVGLCCYSLEVFLILFFFFKKSFCSVNLFAKGVWVLLFTML